MDINIKDLLTYFTFALTLINLYKGLVSNRQESHETNLKETDRAFAEFVKTYSGQYSELKTKIEYMGKDIEELYDFHEQSIKELSKIRERLSSHLGQREGGE